MSVYDVNGNIISTSGGGDSGRQKFPWLNIAHKGTAPEQYGNSLYAFKRSHELGFDGVECDVRMTADNIVVISHDAEVTGKDAQGNTQTLTIINSNFEDLAALTLFTIDGVDQHLLSFDQFIRMAFYWQWHVQLDLKSQANTTDCIIECSKIIRDNGMVGKVKYSGWVSNVETVLAYDPLAQFNVGYDTDISESVYANIPLERLWISLKRQDLPVDISTINRNRPFCIWDVGAQQANMVMEYRPNLIQWTGDTDGVSLSESFLANVQWA